MDLDEGGLVARPRSPRRAGALRASARARRRAARRGAAARSPRTPAPTARRGAPPARVSRRRSSRGSSPGRRRGRRLAAAAPGSARWAVVCEDRGDESAGHLLAAGEPERGRCRPGVLRRNARLLRRGRGRRAAVRDVPSRRLPPPRRAPSRRPEAHRPRSRRSRTSARPAPAVGDGVGERRRGRRRAYPGSARARGGPDGPPYHSSADVRPVRLRVDAREPVVDDQPAAVAALHPVVEPGPAGARRRRSSSGDRRRRRCAARRGRRRSRPARS